MDSVKSVGKIQFDEHLVIFSSVALHPLLGSLQASLTTEGLRHTNLQRPKILFGLLLIADTKNLPHKPPQSFSNRYGASRAVLFWECMELGASKPRSNIPVGLAARQKGNNTAEMLKDAVSAGAGERLPHMKR